MTWRRQAELHRPHTAFVVTLLALTLALAGVLAYQAQRAVRSHQEAAGRVLRDYVSVAAWQFSQHANEELSSALTMGLRRAGAMPIASAAAMPMDAESSGSGCGCPDAGPIVGTFRAENVAPAPAAASGQSARVAIAWSHPPSVQPSRDEAVQTATSVTIPLARDSGFAIEDVAGRPFVFGYRVGHGGAAASVSGFVTELSGLQKVFAHVMTTATLLPPSLTGRTPNEALLTIRVSDARGREVFRSARAIDSRFATDADLGDRFGGLKLSVALQAGAAETLVIGGLPRSRLPLILGLLAMAAGLVVVAVLQLRREHELIRLRAEFVSGASHELRTPLAQIRMFAETLLLDRVRSPEERRRSLQIIERESRRLTHLIENVLCFSRAERGAAAPIHPSRVPLGASLRELADDFAGLAQARGVRIDVRADEDLVAWIDGRAVRQMLLNLLDNAVKYGPRGQTVTVGASREDGRLRLWVDDQGPGVPAADRERVGQPFFRLPRDASSPVAGTGIGLSVVRDLAASHRGRVSVETAPGGGSRFLVEMPWVADPAGAAAAAAPPPREDADAIALSPHVPA